MYQPEIIPSSPTGQALQASIQKQLAHHGWSTEDDQVMAEYCLVMLGNKKTPEQITSELSDLIGVDVFEPSFVSWLFTELAHHYPDPAGPSSSDHPSSSAIGVVSDSRRSPEHDSRRFDDRRGSRNGPGGPMNGGGPRDQRRGGPGPIGPIFGAAMSGVKRDAREIADREQPPHQRARYDRPQGFDGVPAGPRSMAPPPANGRAGGGGGDNRRDAPRNGNDSGKSIFDRVGGGGNQTFAQQGPFDGNNASAPNGGFPQPPAGFNPQMLAQAQAAAMAQAFAAMQSWASQQQGGAGGNPGFNVTAPAFNPAFNPNFGPGSGGEGGFPGAPPRRNNQHQPQHGAGGRPPYNAHQNGASKAAPAPVALPTKPLEEQICKHGVTCTKAACPYSHPSPVATAESGLVLFSEACEKQLACEDPDCSKSHVSVAQKKGGAGATSTTPSVAATSKPSARAPPVADPTAIPGAGEKPCKFAGACTRAGCVFLHPWDVRGDPGNTAGVPCRWAEGCTRADCHFSHPPSRKVPFAPKAPGGGASRGTKSTYSATFHNPKNPTIGAWPSEKPTHVSERLARFKIADPTATDGDVERIIPGEKQAEGDKVEIDFGDDTKDVESAKVEA